MCAATTTTTSTDTESRKNRERTKRNRIRERTKRNRIRERKNRDSVVGVGGVVHGVVIGSNNLHPLNPFYVLPSRCRLVPRDIQRELGGLKAVESESFVPLSGASFVGT